ncbi:prephenate dehydrogenase [Shewanella litorisediminis]|uniref:Prephenate dehydrogenase n=1 Tax=Shewanella litorisediminis TaxID=1173586 RepID=A0ABX7G206_9GAMM|nr:prephenate dehydrogenase [Shewanella litorisediminis]MCL2918533.1 prephenate dehydrogenase [Shewanella litorisediminis]QRH01360.1 prephenate dehydrogenase [Shewanella litorisediminis]
MPYTKVLEQLTENLQLAYRQAIDADTRLDELQKAGMGKFSHIFSAEEGFSTRSNRFGPYVQELGQDFADLKAAEVTPEALELVVRKLGVLLQTLQAFKSQSK